MAISISLVTSTTLLLRVSSTLATTTCNQGEVSQQAYGQLASQLQPHIPYSLWSAGLLAAATHPLQPMVSWPLGCSHTSPTASKRNNLHLLYAPAFASRQNNKDDLVKTLSLTERQRERDINTHYEQKTKADFFLQSKLSFQPSRSSNKGQT